MDARLEPHHKSAFRRPPPPATDRSIRTEMTRHRNAAERSNYDFTRALFLYGVKHGLPNLSRLQCLSELRTLCLVREEELKLADRIEEEMSRPSMLKERVG